MAQFQYQSLAEPVRPSATFSETTQLDKWYRQPVDPPRQPQRVTTVTGLFAIDTKLLTLSERIDLDKWYVRPQEPPRQLQRATTILGWYVIDSTQPKVNVDKWYVRPADSPLQARRLTDIHSLDLVTVTTTFSPDSGFPWVEQLPPQIALKRLTDRESYDLVEVEVSVTFPWIMQVSSPPPLKRLTDTNCLSFGEGVFTSESVTADRWCHFYPDYLRPIFRLTDRECLTFSEGIFTTESTTVDRWAHFYPDYIRPIPRLVDRECLDFGEGVFNVETTTVDRWCHFYSDWIRPLRRLTDLDSGMANFVEMLFGIEFKNSSSGDVAAPGATIDVTFPDGTIATDLLILTIQSSRVGAVPSGDWNPPAGWTSITPGKSTTNDGTNAISAHVWWSLGSNTNSTFTKTGIVDNVGWVMTSYTGVDNVTPIDATGSAHANFGVADVSANSVTIITTGAWEVITWGDFNEGIVTAPDFTPIENTAVNKSAAILFKPIPLSPGPTGPIIVSGNAGTVGQLLDVISFALRPAISALDPGDGFPWMETEPPPRQLKRLTDRDCSDFGEGVFNAESVTIDRWGHFYLDYLRPIPRLTDRECLDYAEGVFNTESVTVDRWNPLPNLPTKPSPKLTDRDGGIPNFAQVFIGVFNPGTGFPWIEVEPAPRQLKRLSDSECLDYGEGVFTTETTSLDKWWQPTSVSPRKVQRLTDVDVGRPDFTDSIFYPGTTGFPWTEIIQPPRPLKRELYSDGIFTTDTKKVVSIDSWIPIDNSPTNNHVKSYRGYFTEDTKQLTVAERTQLDKWWQPTSLPVRPPVRLTDSKAWYATLRDIIIIPIPPTVFLTGGIQTIVSMFGNSQRNLAFTNMVQTSVSISGAVQTIVFASNIAQSNVDLTGDAGSNS